MQKRIKYRLLGFVRPLSNIGTAVVMAAAFTGIAPALAHADDDFQSLPVGTVIRQEPMSLPGGLQSIAHAKRVVYVTTDGQNDKVVSSGMVITPNTPPSHPKIVAWAHGTTGMSDDCAPSSNSLYFYPEAVDAITSYVQQGWVVTATDYQGLGTVGVHQYLVGDSEARSVVDSVRAARNLDSSLSNQWVVSGHSQGGQAVLYAGEVAHGYGAGLNLKGVVAFAPASNLDLIAAGILGTPSQGYLPMALVGLAAADPSLHPLQILAQPARDRLSVLQTGCIDDILAAYADLTPEQMVVGGQVPDSILAALASYGNPAQRPSDAPALLVQGTADETVPPDLTAYLQQEMCAQGDTVDLEFIDGADHDSLPSQTIDLVRTYIQGRFANQTPPSNC